MPDDIIIRNKKRLSSRSRKPEVGSEKESTCWWIGNLDISSIR